MQTILQLTDSHLIADKNAKFLGLNTYASLRAVLENVMRRQAELKPDLVVFSGDISQDESPESYKHFVELMGKLPYQVLWIPGNHDVNDGLKILQQGKNINDVKNIVLGNWQALLLDSHVEKQVAGHFSETTLTALEKSLQQTKTDNVLLFLHHHFFTINCNWLDNIGLQNSTDFLNIISKYPKIKLVLCGHIHQEFNSQHNDITFLAAPSAAFQFKPHTDSFALDNKMPGYRIINLQDNGTFTSQVYRIPFNKKFIPDNTIKGY